MLVCLLSSLVYTRIRRLLDVYRENSPVKNSHIHVASLVAWCARILPSHILHLVMTVAEIAWTYLHSWAKHTMMSFIKIHQTPTRLWLEWQELLPQSFSQNPELLYIKCFLLLTLMQNVDGAQSIESKAFAFDFHLPATRCETWLPPPVGCWCSCWYAPHEPTNVLVQAGASRVQSRTTPNNR